MPCSVAKAAAETCPFKAYSTTSHRNRRMIVDLDQIDPNRQRPVCDDFSDAGGRGLFSVEPGQDRPGVKAYAHRGSRVRSSSRRAAMPVFANLPAKRGVARRAERLEYGSVTRSVRSACARSGLIRISRGTGTAVARPVAACGGHGGRRRPRSLRVLGLSPTRIRRRG